MGRREGADISSIPIPPTYLLNIYAIYKLLVSSAYWHGVTTRRRIRPVYLDILTVYLASSY